MSYSEALEPVNYYTTEGARVHLQQLAEAIHVALNAIPTTELDDALHGLDYGQPGSGVSYVVATAEHEYIRVGLKDSHIQGIERQMREVDSRLDVDGANMHDILTELLALQKRRNIAIDRHFTDIQDEIGHVAEDTALPEREIVYIFFVVDDVPRTWIEIIPQGNGWYDMRLCYISPQERRFKRFTRSEGNLAQFAQWGHELAGTGIDLSIGPLPGEN